MHAPENEDGKLKMELAAKKEFEINQQEINRLMRRDGIDVSLFSRL